MPFKEDFNDVYHTIKATVESAVSDQKLTCIRLDEISRPGKISDDIVQEIKQSEFCVADITNNNPNVMWEVGYAMALNKPVIFVSQDLDNLPFDIRDLRVIKYSRKKIIDTLQEPLKKAVLSASESLFTLDKKKNTYEINKEVEDVKKTLSLLIESEYAKCGYVNIDNYSLDLGVTIHWITYEIINNKDIDNVKYRALMIDCESKDIASLIDGESILKTTFAQSSILRGKEMAQSLKTNEKNISFQIRGYRTPPIIHGFSINESNLFLGYTEVVNDKIFGAKYPYQHFVADEKSSAFVKHMFRVYKSWFDYNWDKGKVFVEG